MEENNSLDGRKRKNIRIGDVVEIVQKQHQRTGELTEGIVKRIEGHASEIHEAIIVGLPQIELPIPVYHTPAYVQ